MAVEADTAINLYTSGLVTKEEARQMIGLEEKPGSDDSGFVTDSPDKEIKKEKKEVQFPESPGKRKGSQKGIKKNQKKDPFSEVKTNSK